MKLAPFILTLIVLDRVSHKLAEPEESRDEINLAAHQ